MALGSPTPPGSPTVLPTAPALPSPPTLPSTPPPPTGTGIVGLQGRGPIVTRVDYSPTATASGGFLATAPASNLLIPRPQLTALAAGGSVSYTVTLASTASIGLIYFVNLVADLSATVSVSAGSYSRTLPVYPSDFSGSYDQHEFERLGRTRFFVMPQGQPAVTGTVDVTISGSIVPVQVGYMGICSIWDSPIGMKYGWDIGIKDLSTLDRVTMGSPYVTEKPELRVLSMAFAFLRQGGVYGQSTDQVFAGSSGPFQAAVIAGKSRPIAGVPFPDDTDNIERLSVAGYINNDQQFTNPFFASWETTFQIEGM